MIKNLCYVDGIKTGSDELCHNDKGFCEKSPSPAEFIRALFRQGFA